MTDIGNDMELADKIWFGLIVVCLILLGAALSQPAWRGDDMLAQMRGNCQKVGGVMLEDKGLLGTSYECAERLDK